MLTVILSINRFFPEQPRWWTIVDCHWFLCGLLSVCLRFVCY